MNDEKQNNNKQDQGQDIFVTRTYPENTPIHSSQMNDLNNFTNEKLEALKKIDSEIQFSVKALENYISQVKQESGDWVAEKKLFQDSLNETINRLATETKMLTVLPDKMVDRLHGAVPKLSGELGNQIVGEFTAKLVELDKQVQGLMSKILAVNTKAQEISTQNFRKKLASIAGIVTLSVIISTFSAWFLVQKLPKFVTISGSGDIIIQGGDISIWGSAKSQIQQRVQGKSGR